MEQGVWLDIVGTDGKYSISSLGRLRSNYAESKLGKRKPTGTILRVNINKNGYKFAHLYYRIDGKWVEKTVKIHRLVCVAFHPNPLNKPQVNHKDLDKLNNNAENLEWCTNRENTLHAQINGRIPTKKPYQYSRIRYYHTKKVIHTGTGQIFSSPAEAAKDAGMTVKKLTRLLANERPNTTPYLYEGSLTSWSYDYEPRPPKKYGKRTKKDSTK